MPRKRKPDPLKFCEYCKQKMSRKVMNGRLEDLNVFIKRKYCDVECMGLAHRKNNPTLSAFHKRAIKFKKNSCELCGATNNLGVHHLDNDPTNNILENLKTFCGKCHTKWHWRNGKKIQRRKFNGE